eukprot:gene15216-9724_t
MLDALDGKDAMLGKMQKIIAGQSGLLDKVTASQRETNKQIEQLKQEVQQKDKSLADTVKGINAERKTELNQALEKSLGIFRADLRKKESKLEQQMKKNSQNSIEEMLKSMKRGDQTLEQMNEAKRAAEERTRLLEKQVLELQQNTKQEGKVAMNKKAEEQINTLKDEAQKRGKELEELKQKLKLIKEGHEEVLFGAALDVSKVTEVEDENKALRKAKEDLEEQLQRKLNENDELVKQANTMGNEIEMIKKRTEENGRLVENERARQSKEISGLKEAIKDAKEESRRRGILITKNSEEAKVYIRSLEADRITRGKKITGKGRELQQVKKEAERQRGELTSQMEDMKVKMGMLQKQAEEMERERLDIKKAETEEANQKQFAELEEQELQLRNELGRGCKLATAITPTKRKEEQAPEEGEAEPGKKSKKDYPVNLTAQRKKRAEEAATLRQRKKEEGVMAKRINEVRRSGADLIIDDDDEVYIPETEGGEWKVGEMVWVYWPDNAEEGVEGWVKGTIVKINKSRRSVCVKDLKHPDKETEWIPRRQWAKNIIRRGDEEDQPDLGEDSKMKRERVKTPPKVSLRNKERRNEMESP